MASLNNNWLGFSVSAQELQNHSQNIGFNSDEISAGTQISSESCFDLTNSDSPNIIPSLNLLPPPFGILEAFNRNTHPQDWNMKDLSMNSNFSCSSTQNMENQERPKLENFLGHCFSDHQEHNNKNLCNPNFNISSSNNYCDNSNYNNNILCQENDHDKATPHTNSTIGLSMIKNWLRNNPAPPHAGENNVGNEAAQPHAAAAGAQTLSLSMSTGSQSSTPLPLLSGNAMESCTSENNKLQQSGSTAVVDGGQTGGAVESMPRKAIDTFGQRTSIYRGVTRHRWTGRYEAHLWDNSCRREGQTRKGRQGGYDKEEKAARAYDLAALKYWGTTTTTNFPISNYEKEIEEMKHMTRQEYVASLRRKSSGFSRGASIYRGVTRHHQHGRWQARIGRVAGNKDLYLGTFSTQEEAAEAYDIAAIKFRGLNAVTNFEINRYDVKSILESTTLPIGGAAKRLKDAENAAEMALEMHRANEANLNLHLTDHHGHMNSTHHNTWPTIAFQQPPHPLSINYPFAPHQSRIWCKQEQDSDVNNHGYNEINTNHQLQLGNTQNFLQPSVLTNIMSLQDNSSVEHSSGSNSVIYGNNVVPMMGTVIVQDATNGFQDGYEGMFGSSSADAAYHQQQARNFYYHQSQQSSSSTCNNNWIPTAVPTVAANSTFTVWNDT
ncbi:hypothetical protein DH2020_029917 [Rehmannia glutinosa]|uniref:AP2/ERF domain-containing protein n=1 Tax=Rehmannia glutinosa TaxID=99300 RepID=A0ABR0VQ67_REHGL